MKMVSILMCFVACVRILGCSSNDSDGNGAFIASDGVAIVGTCSQNDTFGSCQITLR